MSSLSISDTRLINVQIKSGTKIASVTNTKLRIAFTGSIQSLLDGLKRLFKTMG